MAAVVVLLGAVLGTAVGGFVYRMPAGERPREQGKAADDSKEAEALKELEGDWKVVGLEADGRQAPVEELKGMHWTFKGGRLQPFDPGDKPAEKSEVKIDPSKDPRHIDLTVLEGEHKGATM